MHARFFCSNIRNSSLIFMLIHNIENDISSFQFVDRDLLRDSHSLSNAVICSCHLSITSSVLITITRLLRNLLFLSWSRSPIFRWFSRARLEVQIADFHFPWHTWQGSRSRNWNMNQIFEWSYIFLVISVPSTTNSFLHANSLVKYSFFELKYVPSINLIDQDFDNEWISTKIVSSFVRMT